MNRTKTVVGATNLSVKAGPPLWQLDAEAVAEAPSLAALIVTGKLVVVGGGERDGSSGKAFLIDRGNGKIEQVSSLPARVTECGLAAGNGRLHVACENGIVRCFVPRGR